MTGSNPSLHPRSAGPRLASRQWAFRPFQFLREVTFLASALIPNRLLGRMLFGNYFNKFMIFKLFKMSEISEIDVCHRQESQARNSQTLYEVTAAREDRPR